jgi:polyisoprenoid-binding protein YceI
VAFASKSAKSGAAVTGYRVDNSASRFTVRAFAGGLPSEPGHSTILSIRHFSGEIAFNPTAPEQATLKMEIRSDSIEVTDDIKPGDRREMQETMNREVLEVLHVARYPVIAFESTGTSVDKIGDGRYKVGLSANLTLRGVTRNVPVMAQVTTSGDLLLRASGEFSILQSEYGIPPVSIADGALKLKDELKFSFDIVARKQA